MNANGEEEDGNETEVDDGVDQDGGAAGLEVAKFDHPILAGDLEDEARREQDEEDDCHEHWAPVRHLRLLLLALLPAVSLSTLNSSVSLFV